MGLYNPHIPQILGQEWVPIRDESLILNPFANTLERGYTFTLPVATRVNNVRFYLKEWPEQFGANMVFTASVYPEGQEASAGPVRSVVIPSGGVVVTGATITPTPGGFGLTAPQTIFASGDNLFLYWIMGNGSIAPIGLSAFFSVNSYQQLLYGKRILGVDLLIGVTVVSQGFEIEDFFQSIQTHIVTDFGGTQSDTMRLPDLVTNRTPEGTRALVRMHLGDANRFFGVGSGDSAGINKINQWTFPQLARFEQSATNRLQVKLDEGPGIAAILGPEITIEYMAMEVFYCDEARVLTGSRIFNDDIPNRPLRDPLTLGANTITVRNPTTLEENYLLPAGNYTVTLSESNLGDNYYANLYRTVAELNEVRQLYELPTFPGVQINLPFPLNEETIGTEFISVSTDLIPQLTMHVSGGALVDYSHVYGQQSAGQVYSAVTVRQEIDDRYIGAAKSWPWVRYYARRFGSTTTPLKLSGLAPAGGMLLSGVAGTYASTPDTAVLDIVGDIDLRINMTLPDWTPVATSALIAKWGVAGQRSYLFNLLPTGLLELAWSTNGTAVSIADSTAALPVFDQSQLTVRVTLDVNNGAAGNDVMFFYGPSIDGPWTQLGATVTQVGVTSIFSGNLAVEVGSQSIGTVSPLNGIVHNAQIHPGINVAPVATPNFGAQPPGTTSFVDSTGLTWTLNGAATIVGGITGSSVSITPAEFDVLDEIIDGWKEVTLLFPSPPTMGVTDPVVQPTWQWTALGETAGNRWEVLGATAPAVSGISFLTANTVPFNQVPLTQRLYTGTYGYPVSGAAINEDWVPQWGPYVSGTTPDPASDAVLMFAQYMPTVTGFAATVLSQPITGIGQNCGIDPCGIPNRILYNRLTWGRPANTGYAQDSFNRTVSNGLGSADIGGAYTLTATAAEYAVNGSKAVITPAAISIATIGTLANIGPDVDITVTVAVNGALVAGSNARGIAVGRFTDINNYYSALIQSSDAGANLVGIQKTVAGVETVLQTGALVPGINNTNQMRLRFVIQGQQLKAKAWSVYVNEPDAWQIELVDTSLTTGSRAGIGARTGTSTGNAVLFEDLVIGAPDYWFSYYELQRMDTITEWATIMKATSPNVTGFNDFEARVGMLSSYRIRAVDVYEFPGLWSSTASVSLISPGVSGSCLSNAHVMIFTTNERQSGHSNLAYSNAWEGQVDEDFGFAEAGFTQLQPMYDRDFFTAFRPRERGGDQFGRTVLVQAAAIDPETLPGFRALSDMAWEDVSYICVRDEDGNRWFANVNVPSGVVQNRRQLYMASIQIVEVTSTPSPVDP